MFEKIRDFFFNSRYFEIHFFTKKKFYSTQILITKCDEESIKISEKQDANCLKIVVHDVITEVIY